MPKTKKREASSSDSDSGPDDRGPVSKKGAAPAKKSKSGKEEPKWHLGNKKFVKVNEFNGKPYVHIREHYEKDGELLPGKKGIALNAENFQKLKEILSEVEEELSKF
ncbi:Putative RNA polymerase II transcriptional coactivator [Frankliniella fusca]|uniref:RNA polymerase II transcriptional coactivator n=1 Tax=Frankliniella fusca TaxID=407009 RepID=A0AAE1GZR8_9NEOP|nr:Putative RNA polymerase II transcriptional coactivator [Frankliniella fusca]